jgi:hypothetical protein
VSGEPEARKVLTEALALLLQLRDAVQVTDGTPAVISAFEKQKSLTDAAAAAWVTAKVQS